MSDDQPTSEWLRVVLEEAQRKLAEKKRREDQQTQSVHSDKKRA